VEGDTYELEDIAKERRNPGWMEFIHTPTRSESERNESTPVYPDKRYHYRYRAAELAELAAGLLPNNDENAARIYQIAGGWIKLRDPQAANQIYRQLVVHCPDTELGRKAAESRWFPEVEKDRFQPFQP